MSESYDPTKCKCEKIYVGGKKGPGDVVQDVEVKVRRFAHWCPERKKPDHPPEED